jgi:5-methylcytosine-specific restriction endonuclease McrA
LNGNVTILVDNNARFVTTGLFMKRWHVQLTKTKVIKTRWKKEQMDQVLSTQANQPVRLLEGNPKNLWYFHDRFYWDDEGLDVEDVTALLLQRERRNQQRLQSARSLMRAEAEGRPTRIPIPSELRRAVYERDGGRCVECGATFDLQYDHVLPVALGGATTLENLQLLCATCNKRKSDSL